MTAGAVARVRPPACLCTPDSLTQECMTETITCWEICHCHPIVFAPLIDFPLALSFAFYYFQLKKGAACPLTPFYAAATFNKASEWLLFLGSVNARP